MKTAFEIIFLEELKLLTDSKVNIVYQEITSHYAIFDLRLKKPKDCTDGNARRNLQLRIQSELEKSPLFKGSYYKINNISIRTEGDVFFQIPFFKTEYLTFQIGLYLFPKYLFPTNSCNGKVK